jgi:mono/diheme cytochrome c family protein
MNAAPVAAALIALAACRTEQTLVTPDPHLERMLDQPKRMPYEPDPILPGAMTMQRPPDGTLSIDSIVGSPAYATGIVDGAYAERIPTHVDRALVEAGRARFDVFCAACHGVLGDGVSAAGAKMSLRKPPSLHAPPTRNDAPGKTFATIRGGYGLMPSYAVQLSVHDTWGVVAYVHALQLARNAKASDLPPDLRERLAREAR